MDRAMKTKGGDRNFDGFINNSFHVIPAMRNGIDLKLEPKRFYSTFLNIFFRELQIGHLSGGSPSTVLPQT